MDIVLYTFSEVSRRLGIDRRTVGDLAKVKGIPVVRHPANGKAKAIDADGLRQIEEALAVATAS